MVEGNEIVGNNTDDWERAGEGCGCTGGVKFWAVDGADIRGNWVHDNRGPGLWADTNNNDFLIEDNVIEDNDGEALIYETSYNAVIRDNTCAGTTVSRAASSRTGATPSRPAPIYISESGGEPRVKARTDKIEIYGNILENNWSGITLWENADRFCNSAANTSSGILHAAGEGRVAARRRPSRRDPAVQPTAGGRPSGSTSATTGSPFSTRSRDGLPGGDVRPDGPSSPTSAPGPGGRRTWATLVQKDITEKQDNQWHDNTYAGPWAFVVHDTSRTVDAAGWRAEPYSQDECSSFGGGPAGC